MMRRLVPLAMALAIAFAPVALDACQAECARHSTHGSATSVPTQHHAAEPDSGVHAHHVHHTTVPVVHVASDQSINGVPHGCAHGDGLPASVAASLQLALASADVPAILDDSQPPFRPYSTSEGDSPVSTRIARITQLRV